jgi:hypothetical protein
VKPFASCIRARDCPFTELGGRKEPTTRFDGGRTSLRPISARTIAELSSRFQSKKGPEKRRERKKPISVLLVDHPAVTVTVHPVTISQTLFLGKIKIVWWGWVGIGREVVIILPVPQEGKGRGGGRKKEEITSCAARCRSLIHFLVFFFQRTFRVGTVCII